MNWSSEYRYLSQEVVEVVAKRNNKEVTRRFTIRIGDSYVVTPVNPANMKNRGRQCTVRYLKGPTATIEFHDSRRMIRIPLDDLAPSDDSRNPTDL